MSVIRKPASPIRRDRGRRARTAGRGAEWLAALLLIAKGYRILGFRLKTPEAEIDILARKGDVVAVIEVKRRASLAEAMIAVRSAQRQRLLRAAETLLVSRRGFAGAQLRLDLIALSPWRAPRHVAGAWTEDA